MGSHRPRLKSVRVIFGSTIPNVKHSKARKRAFRHNRGPSPGTSGPPLRANPLAWPAVPTTAEAVLLTPTPPPQSGIQRRSVGGSISEKNFYRARQAAGWAGGVATMHSSRRPFREPPGTFRHGSRRPSAGVAEPAGVALRSASPVRGHRTNQTEIRTSLRGRPHPNRVAFHN